jgi:NTP pyrophosphatase (non-canonical NTP hydrolase)
MNLGEIVKGYYAQRKLVRPDARQALLFLVSEVGELADAVVHEEADWVRNNEKARSVEDEIGDVLMMLTALCMAMGVDPVECMIEKMVKKGYTDARIEG